MLAFPNAYYARLLPMGEMRNMKEIQNEVLYAMQPELAPTGEAAENNINSVQKISWILAGATYWMHTVVRNVAAALLHALQILPAKLLSPRKIMMDTRDRVEEVGRNINANKEFKDDGKVVAP